MKRIILIITIFIGITNIAFAQGYRGFVETGAIINFRLSGIKMDIGGETFDLGSEKFTDKGGFSIHTSHGRQFSPYIFFGGGIGIDYMAAGRCVKLPIFADFRTYFLDRSTSPFLSVKLGYALGGKHSEKINPGFYFNPTFGVSFQVGKRVYMNTALGYNLIQELSAGYYYDEYGYEYDVNVKCVAHGLSLRLGIEF